MKRDSGILKATEKLKAYVGFNSDDDGDGCEKVTEDTISRTKLDFNKVDNRIAGLKDKVYKKSDWLKILSDDDLENTSTTEMYASLRYGIPFEL